MTNLTLFKTFTIRLDHLESAISDLSLVYCTMSTSKRLTIYQRISLNFQPKSPASGNALSNNLPRDWQSPALNAKTIFHWHRTSGVGRPECSWNSSRWSYWHSDHRRYQSKHHGFNVILRQENFIYRKSNLISKMRKILSFALPTLWNQSPTPYRIRLCKTLILVW